MKKITMLLLLAAILTATLSCTEKKTAAEPPENNRVASITYKPAEKSHDEEKVKVKIEDIDESILTGGDDVDIDYLYEMRGRWSRPDEYEYLPTDINIPDEFFVNADTSTWIPYTDGNAGKEYPCSADIDGIDLTMPDGTTVSYAFDGIGFLNSDGTAAFIRISEE